MCPGSRMMVVGGGGGLNTAGFILVDPQPHCNRHLAPLHVAAKKRLGRPREGLLVNGVASGPFGLSHAITLLVSRSLSAGMMSASSTCTSPACSTTPYPVVPGASKGARTVVVSPPPSTMYDNVTNQVFVTAVDGFRI